MVGEVGSGRVSPGAGRASEAVIQLRSGPRSPGCRRRQPPSAFGEWSLTGTLPFFFSFLSELLCEVLPHTLPCGTALCAHDRYSDFAKRIAIDIVVETILVAVTTETHASASHIANRVVAEDVVVAAESKPPEFLSFWPEH